MGHIISSLIHVTANAITHSIDRFIAHPFIDVLIHSIFHLLIHLLTHSLIHSLLLHLLAICLTSFAAMLSTVPPVRTLKEGHRQSHTSICCALRLGDITCAANANSSGG